MSVHGVEEADVLHMLDSVVEFALLPRDALHVVIMRRLGITEVASDDADFDRVPGLNRHWIINPPDKARL
jgi:predicted nucleic acid-binding protein